MNRSVIIFPSKESNRNSNCVRERRKEISWNKIECHLNLDFDFDIDIVRSFYFRCYFFPIIFHFSVIFSNKKFIFGIFPSKTSNHCTIVQFMEKEIFNFSIILMILYWFSFLLNHLVWERAVCRMWIEVRAMSTIRSTETYKFVVHWSDIIQG